MLQIFDPNLWSTDICKTQISTINLNFTLKSVSLSNAILSFFSRHGPYFHPTKDRCSTSPTSPFFTFVVILVIFAALKSSNFFLWKIWDIRNSKRAANMNWWFFWMRNRDKDSYNFTGKEKWAFTGLILVVCKGKSSKSELKWSVTQQFLVLR